jgi:cytoskeletal protein RodZ
MPVQVQPSVHSPRDERSENVQIRSLQRRLAQQRRTANILMVALGVVVAMGIIIGIVLTASAPSAGDAGSRKQDNGASDEQAGSDKTGNANAVPANNGPTPTSEATEESSGLVERANNAQPAATVDPRFEQLLTLITLGEDAARSRAERDAALAQAMTLVTQLEGEGVKSVADSTLAELRVRMSRARERMELDELFPD